jgi:ABC-type iron transport system FetAB ATPase subunit
MSSILTNEVNKVMLQFEKTSAQKQALIRDYVGANSQWEKIICQIEALRPKVPFFTEASNKINISQKEMINDIFHHQPIPIQKHINVTIINHDVDENGSDHD